jgi:hypothetical protein
MATACRILGRALLSTRNDLTLIVEDELQPFHRDGAAAKTRDMKLHRLPWPKDQLEALGDAHVELRVTLSYFVEPNPGEREWTRRHRYASHSLRFRVKMATENVDEFRARINQAARDEEEGAPAGGARTGASARSATADRCIRISGLGARRIWRSAMLSACSLSAVGGRKSPTWSGSTHWRDMP